MGKYTKYQSVLRSVLPSLSWEVTTKRTLGLWDIIWVVPRCLVNSDWEVWDNGSSDMWIEPFFITSFHPGVLGSSPMVPSCGINELHYYRPLFCPRSITEFQSQGAIDCSGRIGLSSMPRVSNSDSFSQFWDWVERSWLITQYILLYRRPNRHHN